MAYIKGSGGDLSKPNGGFSNAAQLQTVMAGLIPDLIAKGLVPAGTTQAQFAAAATALQKQDTQAASIQAIKDAVASGRGATCPVQASDMANGVISPSGPNYAILKASAAAGCKMQDAMTGKPVSF